MHRDSRHLTSISSILDIAVSFLLVLSRLCPASHYSSLHHSRCRSMDRLVVGRALLLVVIRRLSQPLAMILSRLRKPFSDDSDLFLHSRADIVHRTFDTEKEAHARDCGTGLPKTPRDSTLWPMITRTCALRHGVQMFAKGDVGTE